MKDVIRVRIAEGVYESVPKQILEVTQTEAFRIFQNEIPELKIGQRAFEMRKPPQVRSAKLTDRFVCGCIYHFRVHYLLQVVKA